jgi:hypothetical protein
VPEESPPSPCLQPENDESSSLVWTPEQQMQPGTAVVVVTSGERIELLTRR